MLGLVPLVSGTGITAFLTTDKQIAWSAATFFLSLFGSSITFALFRWELRNVNHCKWLIARGAELEAALGLESGQFLHRPAAPKLFGRVPIGKERSERIVYTTTILGWLALPAVAALVTYV